MKKIVSILLCMAMIVSTSIVSFAENDYRHNQYERINTVGNTGGNILNGGIMAFYKDKMYYANELINGALCCKTDDDQFEIITNDTCRNINISSDGLSIVYSTNNRYIKQIDESKKEKILFQSPVFEEISDE